MLVALPITAYAHELRYWQLDTKGQIQAQGRLSLEALKRDFQGAPLTLLLPTGAATSYRLMLPVKHKKAIAKSLPFALEEYLAEDLEQLHICQGPPVGPWQVAVVVAKALLEHWQEALKDVFKLNAVVPVESLYRTFSGAGVRVEPSPWVEDEWVVLSDRHEPVMLDHALLKLWLKPLHEQPITLVKLSADQLELDPRCAYTTSAEPIPLGQLLNAPGINLLTGPYRAATTWPWHTWRYALAASVLAGALGALSELQSLHALTAQKAELSAQLSALRQHAGVPSHAPLGPVLYQVLTLSQPTAWVTAIRADREKIELTLRLESFAKLASLRQTLEQAPHLGAELQEASALAQGVQTLVSVPRRAL